MAEALLASVSQGDIRGREQSKADVSRLQTSRHINWDVNKSCGA